MCNVGSTIAGTTSVSYGNYFQWGRSNAPFPSTGNVPTIAWPKTLTEANNATGSFITSVAFSTHDWLTPQDNNRLWGWGTDQITGTYADRTPTNQALMQWPCAYWYHVPTAKEWCDTVNSLAGTPICSNYTNVNLWYILKIPAAGMRYIDWWLSSPTYAMLASSSPSSDRTWTIEYHYTWVFNYGIDPNNFWVNVRCQKN